MSHSFDDIIASNDLQEPFSETLKQMKSFWVEVLFDSPFHLTFMTNV